MSGSARSVRAINDGQKRRKAKQARRAARRRATRDQDGPDEGILANLVRKALDTGHPPGLLTLVGYMIETVTSDRLSDLKSGSQEQVRFDGVITGLAGLRVPENTVLLAVLAELLVDDELPQRCRQEVARRDDPLPEWITQLPYIQIYRVVRMTHVLGDRDDLLLGVRLAGGHELTCVAAIDHLTFSDVSDAVLVPDSIDAVLSGMAERSDPDISFVEMTMGDARARIAHGMAQPLFPLWREPRPGCRVLLQWLVAHLPEGGQRYQRPGEDWQITSAVLNAFFASPQGGPFNDRFGHRELLGELVDSGTGDPLRWSAFRIKETMGHLPFDESMPLEVQLQAPDLLRAFVPVAHALSGIREELTARALAAVDESEQGYRERVLAEAKRWGEDEDWTWTA